MALHRLGHYAADLEPEHASGHRDGHYDGLLDCKRRPEGSARSTRAEKKQYAAGLVHYREASELAPQHAAPFFGIYMVARATGNAAMADSALANRRLRNGPPSPAPRWLHDSVLGRMHELTRKKATT